MSDDPKVIWRTYTWDIEKKKASCITQVRGSSEPAHTCVRYPKTIRVRVYGNMKSILLDAGYAVFVTREHHYPDGEKGEWPVNRQSTFINSPMDEDRVFDDINAHFQKIFEEKQETKKWDDAIKECEEKRDKLNIQLGGDTSMGCDNKDIDW